MNMVEWECNGCGKKSRNNDTKNWKFLDDWDFAWTQFDPSIDSVSYSAYCPECFIKVKDNIEKGLCCSSNEASREWETGNGRG